MQSKLYLRGLLIAALAQTAGHVVSQNCAIPSYGTPCGTTMFATYRLEPVGRTVDLVIATSSKSRVGLVFAGDRAISLAFPGGCRLLTPPQIVVPIGFDANGRSRLPWRTPFSSRVLNLCVQAAAIEFGGGQIRARTSNGLKLGPWLGVQALVEDFASTRNRDDARTTLRWRGNGVLAAPGFPVVNELGDFDARIGGRPTGKRDSAGRLIYEFNTDLIVIPAWRTPDRKEKRITDGVLNFRTFTVNAATRVRFIGKNPVRISCVDDIVIEGAVDVNGADGTKLLGAGSRPPKVGQAGFRGGAGGGRGGRGGDTPHRVGQKVVDGAVGEAPTPAGHPLAATLAKRGGTGSLAYPRPPVDQSVRFSAYSNAICQTATSGAAGANFVTRGLPGSSFDNGRGSQAPKPYDFGPATHPSVAVTRTIYTSLPPTLESSRYFLIGGAGGGGAGTHPSSAYDAAGFQPLNWSPGSGGAGGGGAILLRSAGRVRLVKGANLEARGGSGVTFRSDQVHFTNPAPGGAGSGGSIVLQSIDPPDLRGTIDVRGGSGGRYDSSPYNLRVDSLSGRGGDGLFRIESETTPDLQSLTTFPKAGLGNAAKLRTIDKGGPKGVAYSKWIDTQRLPAAWHHYVLRATVAGKKETFSDVPAFGTPLPPGLTVELQSVRYAGGKELGPPTAWHRSARALATDPNRGNAVRFRIRIDTTNSAIVVDDFLLRYDC